MKFKSSIITTGSGKLGGNVFNKNGTIRAFAMPTVSQSNKSLEQRAVSTGTVNAWKDLTPLEQTAWNGVAANYPRTNSVGDTKVPSGYQVFMLVNGAIQAASGPPFKLGEVVSAPPGRIAPPELSPTFNQILSDAMQVTTTGAGSATTSLVIWATPPLSPGRTKAKKSDYRILYRDANTLVPSTIDFNGEYVDMFGQPAIGSKVGFRAVAVNRLTGETKVQATAFATISA